MNFVPENEVVEYRDNPEGVVRKAPYHGWEYPVLAVLADGREYPYTLPTRLKRDAVAKRATLPFKPQWRTSFEFDDAGRHTMTCTEFGTRPTQYEPA